MTDLPEGADFICADCGAVVFTVGLDPTPGRHQCFNCRWIADHPDAPEEIKRMLRGEDR